MTIIHSLGRFLQKTPFAGGINRAYASWQLSQANRRELRTPRFDPGGSGIRVSYGMDALPDDRAPVSGGIVKCLDLAERWPNHERGATLLYLVSSSLPLSSRGMVEKANANHIPLVWNQNGVAYPAWSRNWKRVNRPLVHGLHRANHVVYQSQFCKTCADRFLGETDAPYSILPNPVDTSVFKPAEPGLSRPIRILTAGSHHEWYRVKSAIHSFAGFHREHPESHLVIAGKYVWRERTDLALAEAEAEAEKLGIASFVSFPGPYTQERGIELMQESSLLLHTKVNDPCPRLIVEAMACGLPIVHSQTGGLPELVSFEAGIGIEGVCDWNQEHPPDERLLTEAMLKVCDDLDSFSTAARLRAVSRFDLKQWMDRHAEIFESVNGGTL